MSMFSAGGIDRAVTRRAVIALRCSSTSSLIFDDFAFHEPWLRLVSKLVVDKSGLALVG